VKTRLLFDEYQRRGMAIHYVPIDISASMLEESARHLMTAYPRLRIVPSRRTIGTDSPRYQTRKRVSCCFGSNLSNFT
jgi:uncharacterized SAM-dependent methyltransferase